MLINQKFNTLTFKEYIFFIDNHEKYTDFNTLGLYRSIVENEKITLEEKIEVRNYAHKKFGKSFEFLQLKDPRTYFEVSTLGMEITKADEKQFWINMVKNQQKILESKKIKHRNFGDYSKHNCGYEDCPYNGLMIRQGSGLQEGSIHFDTDKNSNSAKMKSERLKRERKRENQIIKKNAEDG
jgi:hypothetical protein